MNLGQKIVGQDGLHLSRAHDEKGNRISIWQTLEIPLTGLIRLTQLIADRPYLPWIPFIVTWEMSKILNTGSRVLEFGSGRSTVWYARHALSVVSVEDNQAWFGKMSRLFSKLHISNVDYRLQTAEGYVNTSGFEAEQFDLIVVDGSYRAQCIEDFHFALKVGGFLYLDNSDKDMTIPNGDMRIAEARLLDLSKLWGSSPQYYTGYAPGQFFPHQGILLEKRRVPNCGTETKVNQLGTEI